MLMFFISNERISHLSQFLWIFFNYFFYIYEKTVFEKKNVEL